MRVYSVTGVAPEIQAYAMAKYSRSSQSMAESIGELSTDKAAAFLDTFYFQYGHRSIADLAHLNFAVEDISLLAAIRVVDEPLWDGQERSTRYQDFRKTGYITPPGLDDTLRDRFQAAAAALFAAYEDLTARLTACLMAAVPRPDGMAEGAYRRTLRARAFDVSRGLLPLATVTSVGQVVSARVLEGQIGRLLADPYPEVRAIGEALREACRTAPLAPTADRLRDRIASLDLADDDRDALLADLEPAPAAPTLVKYTAPAEFEPAMLALARRALDEAIDGTPAERSARVTLAAAETPEDEAVATLLYAADPCGRSYRQIQEAVWRMGAGWGDDLLARVLALRGRYDDLPRHFRAGQALTYDLLVDIGALRDLHRHRRCVQFIQPWTAIHGPESAEEVFRAGLGAAAPAAFAAGLAERYTAALGEAYDAHRALADVAPDAAAYLLPLATRARALFKMDPAQAVYLVEQRTAPAGHFSYRRIAWEMGLALRERHPAFAQTLRAADPDAPFNLLQPLRLVRPDRDCLVESAQAR